MKKVEIKVGLRVSEDVSEAQIAALCKDIEEITAIRGVPPKDAVLYVVQTTCGEWHIAFDYKFMGRWVSISTTGKYIERNEVEFSQRCDTLRD